MTLHDSIKHADPALWGLGGAQLLRKPLPTVMPELAPQGAPSPTPPHKPLSNPPHLRLLGPEDNIVDIKPDAPVWRLPALFVQSAVVLAFGLVFSSDTEQRKITPEEMELENLRAMERVFRNNNESVPAWLSQALAAMEEFVRTATLIAQTASAANERPRIVNSASGGGSATPQAAAEGVDGEDHSILRLVQIELEQEKLKIQLYEAVVAFDAGADNQTVIDSIREQQRQLTIEHALLIVRNNPAKDEYKPTDFMTRAEREAAALAAAQATALGRTKLAVQAVKQDFAEYPLLNGFGTILGAEIAFGLNTVAETPGMPALAAFVGAAAYLGGKLASKFLTGRLKETFESIFHNKAVHYFATYGVGMAAASLLGIVPFRIPTDNWVKIVSNLGMLAQMGVITFLLPKEIRILDEQKNLLQAPPDQAAEVPQSEVVKIDAVEKVREVDPQTLIASTVKLDMYVVIPKPESLGSIRKVFTEVVSADTLKVHYDRFRNVSEVDALRVVGSPMVPQIFVWLHSEPVTEQRRRTALYLLALLGHNAKNALPELQKMRDAAWNMSVSSEITHTINHINADMAREAERQRFLNPPKPE